MVSLYNELISVKRNYLVINQSKEPLLLNPINQIYLIIFLKNEKKNKLNNVAELHQFMIWLMKSTFNYDKSFDYLHFQEIYIISFLYTQHTLFICIRYWFDIFKKKITAHKIFHAKKSDWISILKWKKNCKSCWCLCHQKISTFLYSRHFTFQIMKIK